jgi:V8-like Glu-specific endopeptidase
MGRSKAWLACAGGALALAAIVAGALAVTTSSGANERPEAAGASIVTARPTERAAAVRAYWTRERMREARPVEELFPAGARADRGAAPLPARPEERRPLHHRVRHIERFPARTNGVSFFHLDLPNPGDFQCSATAVKSPNRSLVLTAGHCVFDSLATGGFATKWVFVPAYNHGGAPFGRWPATSLAKTDGWQSPSSGDFRYDVGFATVAERRKRSLEGRIGARPIAFNQRRKQKYEIFGYPALPPPRQFDGKHLFRCDSRYRGADRGAPDPKPLGVSCDMHEGSSGGAWVIHHKSVAGLTSYGRSGQPDRLYGPYFGGVVKSLYDVVKKK